MTDTHEAARAVLERFEPQLRWTVASVIRSFQLPPSHYDDVRQEAEVLLMSYAGLMTVPSWGHGRLERWEHATGNNEARVKHLVGRQLRVDLSQRIFRQEHIVEPTDSIDELIDTDEEPTDTLWEDRMIETVDNVEEAFEYRAFYPTFAMNVLDNKSQPEIAEELDISLRTVERRISQEKHTFLTDFVTSRGLRLEGDESDEELLEARGYLKGAGR